MYFLDATTDWMQAIGSWGSLIIGIVTLILAVITYFQNSRIKTLTDLVEELARQTAIMREQFNLEKEIHEPAIAPRFVIKQVIGEADPNRRHISLLNIGANATDLQVYEKSSAVVSTRIERSTILADESCVIRVDLTHPTEESYWITIKFTNQSGTYFRQQLKLTWHSFEQGNPIREP